MTTTTSHHTAAEFADRLFGVTLGLIDVLAGYLGDRLGWYRALAAGGPATPAELVARAGGSERYAREWLEQQAGSGILALADDGRRPAAGCRRIALARAYPESSVEGWDVDAPSIELARASALTAELTDRLSPSGVRT